MPRDPSSFKRLLILPIAIFGLVAFSVGIKIGEEFNAYLYMMRDIETAAPRPAAPVRLIIPALGLDAPVVDVGQTPIGTMEVPAHPQETGWFKLGVRPGETGNAVLAGHLDTVSGRPAVFWSLHTLKAGDEVRIIDARGNLLRFRVTGSETYDHDKAPLEEIFGTHDASRLNLITCNGAWDGTKQLYDKRLVVFTERIE